MCGRSIWVRAASHRSCRHSAARPVADTLPPTVGPCAGSRSWSPAGASATTPRKWHTATASSSSAMLVFGGEVTASPDAADTESGASAAAGAGSDACDSSLTVSAGSVPLCSAISMAPRLVTPHRLVSAGAGHQPAVLVRARCDRQAAPATQRSLHVHIARWPRRTTCHGGVWRHTRPRLHVGHARPHSAELSMAGASTQSRAR